jgi:hypothetical protein
VGVRFGIEQAQFLPKFTIMDVMKQRSSKTRKTSSNLRNYASKIVGKQKKRGSLWWESLPEEELLDQRICDLGVSLTGTPVEGRIDRLYRELRSRGINFRPHIWLSDDWFSPDGVPGFAIPFYLAHPRLVRLERSQMLEVEGGTESWCLRIMRHESGHVLDTAYQLHRRKKYKQIFGNYFDTYPDFYSPRPDSRRFVLHLEPWYAQSHPAEDFAETFAVWLQPRSGWRNQYKDWPAIKKIEYVDDLMSEIAGKQPKLKSRAKIDPLNRIRKTLRQYYQEKRSRYGVGDETDFDRDLLRLFVQRPNGQRGKSASSFLESWRKSATSLIAHWTDQYRYNVNHVMREMIERARQLKLNLPDDVVDLEQKLMIVLTKHTLNCVRYGVQRVAL